MSVCVCMYRNGYNIAYQLFPVRFITIWREAKTTLRREIAPRKNDPLPNFFYIFFLIKNKIDLKMVDFTPFHPNGLKELS